MGVHLDSGDLEYDSTRALMAAVRVAADRIKSRLPAHVDLEQVVSAGYLALAKAQASREEESEKSFEDDAISRVSAAMVAALRTTSPR